VEEDEEAEIGMWEAVTWLAVLTLWVSFLSEYLVNAIEVLFFSNSKKRIKMLAFVHLWQVKLVKGSFLQLTGSYISVILKHCQGKCLR
jgi:hypothetical protein